MAVAVFTSNKNNTTMKEPVEKGEDGVTLELSTLGAGVNVNDYMF